MRKIILLLLLLVLSTLPLSAQTGVPIMVQPGDTWEALALRYDSDAALLKSLNFSYNPDRQPTIGAAIVVPDSAENHGVLARVSPWRSASLHALAENRSIRDLVDPITSQPFELLSESWRALLLPDQETPIRDLPPGFVQFEMSHVPGVPGEGMGVRGVRVGNSAEISTTLLTTTIEPISIDSYHDGRHTVGLAGTGAFYPIGTQELLVEQDGLPSWSQPWLFVDGDWEFQEITFTGAAAAIDNNSIADERVRMFALWSQKHPDPFWRSEFQLPILEEDIFAYTSGFGARRSYNGGPYSSYHEGVDFAAFQGVPALATTSGVVVLAEWLFVRGGAVIIDHGLGIFSGYYHLSEVSVNRGDIVEPGQQIGAVGTTGLSTGNHLHWDFLVGGTWVGADKWSEREMGCWVLEGIGKRCWDVSPE